MIRFERLGVVLRPEKEYQAKFNAGMALVGDQVHMLYRYTEKRERWHGRAIDWAAVGEEFPYVANHIRHALLSRAGALLSDDDAPVIFPEKPWEAMGCEDPRIVLFEGAYYVFYCAFDGRKPRVGIARTADFVHFEKLGIVDTFSNDKDAFIFPQRINGAIAYVHRIEPWIEIDYARSIEELFSTQMWEGYESRWQKSVVLRGAFDFDETKVGAGVPPILTDRGWLFLYHGIDGKRHYHLGAALLAAENPSRVLARLPYPLLSPEADYEVTGDYHGCVFPQGQFVDDGWLFISYGAADRFTALAKIRLDELLDELARHPFASTGGG